MSIITKILTETVLKVTDGNSYYYRCQATATLNDGKVLIFGIKTKPNSYHAKKVMVKTDKGYVDTVEDETVKTLKAKFFNFLRLMNGCFGDKAKDGRNGLKFLNDRLLQDLTPAKERPQYTAIITKAICLVNGEFVLVDGGSFMVDDTYATLPLDLSMTEWKKVNNPSQAFIQAVNQAQAWYRGTLTRNNLKAYHQKQVERGLRI